MHDYVKAAHDCGVLAGVSAHNPDCIKRVADEGWEVDFFMTCFYFLTRKIVHEDAEIPTLDFGLAVLQGRPEGDDRGDPPGETALPRLQDPGRRPPLLEPADGARGVPVRLREHQAHRRRHRRHVPWFFDEVSANAGYTRELAGS